MEINEPLIRDGLTLPQLATLVRELNLSGFLPPSDELLVRLVVSEDRFSKLSAEKVDGKTIYEIKLNLPGLVLIANLARCILGDHSDAATYIDSVLGATYFSFSDETSFSIVEMFSILERTRPETFLAVRKASKEWGDFSGAADEVRAKFYSAFAEIDHNDFCIEAAARFIVGHELGHYVKRTNPELTASLIREINALEASDIETDTELFCDVVGILHSMFVQDAKKEKLRPTVVVLGLILTFFDALFMSGHSGEGRKTTSGCRYGIFIKIAENLYKEHDQMALDLMDLSVNYEAILYPTVLAIDDIFAQLQKKLRLSEYESGWALNTRSFPIEKM